jgi:hypothetical protein
MNPVVLAVVVYLVGLLLATGLGVSCVVHAEIAGDSLPEGTPLTMGLPAKVVALWPIYSVLGLARLLTGFRF